MARAMARLRHIALVTDDPSKTAEYYKNCFGLQELFRKPADTGADGVWLSDGYIYIAIVNKLGRDDFSEVGPGHAPTFKGIHHIGFNVEDLEQARSVLKAANTTTLENYAHPTDRPMEKISKAENLKCIGPDGVRFDVRERGWDEAIGAKMQLYQLKPASPADKQNLR